MSKPFKEKAADVASVLRGTGDVEILASKARSFDSIVSGLAEAGIDTSNLTHMDTVELVSSLALSGIDAAAKSILSNMVGLHKEVALEHALIKRVTSEFVSDANKDVSAVVVFMNGFKELTKKVEALAKESESTKELLAPVASGAIQDVQRIGRQLAEHGKPTYLGSDGKATIPTYQLPVDTADFINGLKMLMGATVIPDKGQKHVR